MPVTFKCDVCHTEAQAKNHGYGVWYPAYDSFEGDGWYIGPKVLCPRCDVLRKMGLEKHMGIADKGASR